MRMANASVEAIEIILATPGIVVEMVVSLLDAHSHHQVNHQELLIVPLSSVKAKAPTCVVITRISAIATTSGSTAFSILAVPTIVQTFVLLIVDQPLHRLLRNSSNKINSLAAT